MFQGSSHRLCLPRAKRLQRSGEFKRVRDRGRRLAQGTLIANWMVLPPPACSRLGVVTSRKVGGAVLRARARRLLREVFRRHQHELAAPVDLVLIARPSIAGKGLQAVEHDYLSLLRRARLLKKTE